MDADLFTPLKHPTNKNTRKRNNELETKRVKKKQKGGFRSGTMLRQPSFASDDAEEAFQDPNPILRRARKWQRMSDDEVPPMEPESESDWSEEEESQEETSYDDDEESAEEYESEEEMDEDEWSDDSDCVEKPQYRQTKAKKKKTETKTKKKKRTGTKTKRNVKQQPKPKAKLMDSSSRSSSSTSTAPQSLNGFKKCNKCLEWKIPAQFSKSQLKMSSKKRKCKTCVDPDGKYQYVSTPLKKNKKNHGPTRVNADTFSVLLQHVTPENQATRLPLVSPTIREDYRRFIDACSSDTPYDVCFEALKGVGGTESATILNLGCGWNLDAFEATGEQHGFSRKNITHADFFQYSGCDSIVPVPAVDKLPFQDGQFDAIVLANASYNFDTIETVQLEVERVLTPTGILVFLQSNNFLSDHVLEVARIHQRRGNVVRVYDEKKRIGDWDASIVVVSKTAGDHQKTIVNLPDRRITKPTSVQADEAAIYAMFGNDDRKGAYHGSAMGTGLTAKEAMQRRHVTSSKSHKKQLDAGKHDSPKVLEAFQRWKQANPRKEWSASHAQLPDECGDDRTWFGVHGVLEYFILQRREAETYGAFQVRVWRTEQRQISSDDRHLNANPIAGLIDVSLASKGGMSMFRAALILSFRVLF